MNSIFVKIISCVFSFLMSIGLLMPDDFRAADMPVKADDAIRVVSFNLRNSDDTHGLMKGRSRLIVTLLRQYKPDSFGVQECSAKWLSLLSMNLIKDYDVYYRMNENSSSAEATAVFYLRDKYEAVDKGVIWLTETPTVKGSMSFGADLPRTATWVKLKNRETGECYTHVNTHLHHMHEETRVAQAEVLLTKINELKKDGTPLVLTGDFNTAENSPTYNLISAELCDTKYMAARSDSGLTYHDYGRITDFDLPIDFIFVSPGAEVDSYKIIDDTYRFLYPSDHYGLCSDIRF